MTRAVAYLRVSSPSQVEGYSLDAQERLFKELCKNRSWEPVEVYREEGCSAHNESMKKRPVFRQLLEDAANKKFDLVVVHTLDRWSRNLRVTLESLVVPEVNAAEEAGKLLIQLPSLWEAANLEERRKLLLTMLDAVYVDAKESRSIVAVQPKPPFRPVFQVATTREGSGIRLINEPLEDSPEARSCSWWRRGRVELPVQRSLPKIYYRLS